MDQIGVEAVKKRMQKRISGDRSSEKEVKRAKHWDYIKIHVWDYCEREQCRKRELILGPQLNVAISTPTQTFHEDRSWCFFLNDRRKVSRTGQRRRWLVNGQS